MMGNEAIVRGALEAGVQVVSGYPGTPASEIIHDLAQASKDREMYVEWSTNEKVALEVAAAGSFAGLRALCAMKQVGINVASDFLLHLSESGTRGGCVLVSCDDPGAIASDNEMDPRYYAKFMEIPLLEPGSFQELKEITKWAFELSEEIRNVVLLRSVSRLSHASADIVLGDIPEAELKPYFKCDGAFIDPMSGPMTTYPVVYKHQLQQRKLKQAAEIFENSPFNTYHGPERPELLIITSSVCNLYSKEVVRMLKLEQRVGILKLATVWPLPNRLIEKHLRTTEQVLIIEEGLSFMEENVKVIAMNLARDIGVKKIMGRHDGTFPSVDGQNLDLMAKAIAKIFDLLYKPVADEYVALAALIATKHSPVRELGLCPGCPHRASFFSLNQVLKQDNRQGFVCGDIGCYTLGALPAGFSTVKTAHSMGSGTGLASGFGSLRKFGLKQPVVSVCGDSTFFHTVMPALVNAVHQDSDMTLVVLDNSGTAMTGFQPHPGIAVDAQGNPAPKLDIPTICEAIGAKVSICDTFDMEATQRTLQSQLDDPVGVKVVVLRQPCVMSPERKGKKCYEITIDSEICRGDNCGCNRFCTRVFKCPGLVWDAERKMTRINEALCNGCGVCVSVCPSGAIQRKEVA